MQCMLKQSFACDVCETLSLSVASSAVWRLTWVLYGARSDWLPLAFQAQVSSCAPQ
jgi:hypothetical protein